MSKITHLRELSIKKMVPTKYPFYSFLWLLIFFFTCCLAGCGTFPGWMPSSGPSREQVLDASADSSTLPIQVVDVTESIASDLIARQKKGIFSETLGNYTPHGYIVGPGDMVEISIWESPPAVLFGSGLNEASGSSKASNVSAFPSQMVSSDGTINIPFAGRIPAAGKTPQQIEADIVDHLTGKANQPQVLVRVVTNATSNVTVVGEVTQSTRVPLTARGERLLDALATAGGVRQPVGKISLQITRGNRVQTMPLDTIIRDPLQNIYLQPGDVLTALYQSSSFTVLGATGKNAEIEFEAKGITLSQALGRSGGLVSSQADARAVFIFRKENRDALHWKTSPKTTLEGLVPVIYQVNLKDPASFFIAQSFPIQDKDMLYVSTSPVIELQKFMSILIQPVGAARQLDLMTK
ncbi:MAG: polysaccharide export protein [Desulfobulbus sp.]|nr:polysaccharide export protein [Desulfobulbus sp.]